MNKEGLARVEWELKRMVSERLYEAGVIPKEIFEKVKILLAKTGAP